MTQAKIISVVQQKGGAGKTTLIATLASVLAGHGARILVVDTDEQRTLHEWAAKDRAPIDYAYMDYEKELWAFVDGKRPNYDFIFIDTAGFKNALAVYAIGVADIVLIPTKADEANARGAVRTFLHSKEVVGEQERDPRILVVLMDVDRTAKITKAVLQSLDDNRIPRLKTLVYHRVGFKEMFSDGEGPKGPAQSVAHQLVAEFQQLGLLPSRRAA